MTGLDTNIIISMLFDEEERALPIAPPYYLSLVVIAELAWVLRATFKMSRDRCRETLSVVTALQGFKVEQAERVTGALEAYKNGSADFTDYLIALGNAAAGCDVTLTQDKKAAREPGFTLLT